MAEQINVENTLTKEEKYQTLVPQIEALIEGEEDQVANLANVAAALKEGFGFFWVGYYIVKQEELVLGPFQGPVACTRIAKGKGVCGAAWANKEVIIVDDVEQYPGHIACNAASRSEIVIPVIQENKVLMVLDVDSDRLADFDIIDAQYLKAICHLLVPISG